VLEPAVGKKWHCKGVARVQGAIGDLCRWLRLRFLLWTPRIFPTIGFNWLLAWCRCWSSGPAEWF